MAPSRYEVNDAGVAKARELIAARQYVLDSDWGSVQPNAAARNAFLERHSWEEYAAWHLGLTVGANDESDPFWPRRVIRSPASRRNLGPAGVRTTDGEVHR